MVANLFNLADLFRREKPEWVANIIVALPIAVLIAVLVTETI